MDLESDNKFSLQSKRLLFYLDFRLGLLAGVLSFNCYFNLKFSSFYRFMDLFKSYIYLLKSLYFYII